VEPYGLAVVRSIEEQGFLFSQRVIAVILHGARGRFGGEGTNEIVAGALILGEPMWSSNCVAEPCVSDAEPVCPGDLDNSGIVSISDLLLLLSVYGEECP